MEWYIDAWAVWDGAAFVSQRDEEASVVRQTVFVSPPDFSPVPVARISTAWAAARGHFQERLFDADDTEVSFSTLGQAIETVRRAFLKGGGDTPGGFLAPAILPGVEGGDDTAGPPPPESMNFDKARWTDVVGQVEILGTSESRSVLAKKLAHALRDPDLQNVLSKYTLEVFALLLRSMFAEHSSSTQVELFDLCRVWRSTFLFTGLVNEKYRHTFIASLKRRLAGQTLDQLDRLDQIDWPSEARMLRDELIAGLLFKLPLLTKWPNENNATSLGDLLCVICADRKRLLEEIKDVRHFAPILVAALTIAIAKVGLPPFIFDTVRDKIAEKLQRNRAEVVYETAGRWLAEILPGRELKGHIAEEIIAELARVERPADAREPHFANGIRDIEESEPNWH